MSETPIIDAIVGKGRAHAGTGLGRSDVLAVLRAANPWEPLAEEIEAMAEVLFDPLRPEAAIEDAIGAYRARPIMRELYPEKV